jgi:hypothetical protein
MDGCWITNAMHAQRPDLFGGGLHVHHITPTEEFANDENPHYDDNLISLCATHHMKVEHGEISSPQP